jgi:hypothetical protein
VHAAHLTATAFQSAPKLTTLVVVAVRSILIEFAVVKLGSVKTFVVRSVEILEHRDMIRVGRVQHLAVRQGMLRVAFLDVLGTEADLV